MSGRVDGSLWMGRLVMVLGLMIMVVGVFLVYFPYTLVDVVEAGVSIVLLVGV